MVIMFCSGKDGLIGHMGNCDSFVLRGTVVYSKSPGELACLEDGYAVCLNGVSQGVYEKLPCEFEALPVKDTEKSLIIPGLIDLHIHAPQYQFRGNGMDMELLSWLESYTFPEEAKYADLSYAGKAYRLFTDELRKGFTTRACVFATSHRDATLLLMRLFEESGLVTFVGKVNMDRNVPSYYRESTQGSLADTEKWLEQVKTAGFTNTYPIITPRFTVSCTGELMKGLAELAKKHSAPVQSHLSENLSEIRLVKELEPDTACYAQSYEKAGLLDVSGPVVMAHCVHSGKEELALLKEKGVFIAHCPESNTNLCSGAAPASKYLEMGINLSLATDVAGGSSTSMLAAVRNAVYVSKLRFSLLDDTIPPLTFPQAFYIATKGGGRFFGNAGSFEKGAPFDALVLEDGRIFTAREGLSPEERLERFVYLGDERYIKDKYVSGRRIAGYE